MTSQRSELHIESPIADAKEIPFDPAKRGPGLVRYTLEFTREEMERLKARSSRGTEPFGRFIKRAALEAADREAAEEHGDSLHAAD